MKRSKISIAMSRLWSLPPAKWIPLGLRTTASLKGEEALLRTKLAKTRRDALAEIVEARKRSAINRARIVETGIAKPADIPQFANQEVSVLKKLVEDIRKAEKKSKQFEKIRAERKARKQK